MIHLAITDHHLLCAQWTHTELGSLLTGISYKPFPHPLKGVWNSEAELVSVFSSALQQIRDEVSLEREQIYVTLPNDFVRTVSIQMDKTMGDSDGWALAEWTFKQRWGSVPDSKLALFGRIYRYDRPQLILLAIQSKLIEPIKLIIAEQGAAPEWMGTESSVFFGLEPEKGCMVLFPKGNAVRFHSQSENGSASGSLKLLRGQWKVTPTTGSLSEEDLPDYSIYIGAGFSDKWLDNFKSLNSTILSGLEGLDLEGIPVDKTIPKHLLTITRALYAGVKPKQNQLNFFGDQGIQSIPVKPPPEPKTPVPTSIKKSVKPKRVVKKVKSKRIQKVYSIGITIILLAFLVGIIYMNKVAPPEPSDKSGSNKTQPAKLMVGSESDFLTSSVIKTYRRYSVNILKSVSNTLKLFNENDLFTIISEADTMLLIFGGTKDVFLPLDSIGEIKSSQTVKIDCCGGYEHKIVLKPKQIQPLANYRPINSSEFFNTIRIDSALVNYKTLTPKNFAGYSQVPVILQVSTKPMILGVIQKLFLSGRNIVVEKFIYSSDPLEPNQVAVFFISIFENPPFSEGD
ncbi:MAG: hypothetical protein ACE5D2_00605 [Fidelibacterota bacterium]